MNWQRLFRDPALRLAVFTLWGMAGFVLSLDAYLRGNLAALGGLIAFGDEQKAAALLLFLMVGVEGVLWSIGTLLLLEWYAVVMAQPRPPLQDRVLGWWLPAGVFLLVSVYFHGFLTKEGVWPPDEVAGICIRAAKGPGTLLFLVALAAVAGLFLTALRVRTDLTHCLKLEDVSDCVRAYLRLKRYQDRFLALAGVILGASVVTAVLLIRAYNTPGAGLPSHHPETFSYTYAFAHAGFFSLGLAVAFLVARQPLLAVGESLRERLTGAPPGAAGDIGPWLAADREAKALLQLRAYSLPAVAEAASILAPLIGAVVPALLGGV